ncbi:hypothetical protein AVEN_147685-1 [Araneus ventricosus]|uniref:Uncharacterized protein n=1 Tax=Araneus ventricosus TaxID=182803 RepID=A0A4Y2RLB1_ARAVE|nr:hypothetical protein AVEN_147685-1 [Araneus ventricosus]
MFTLPAILYLKLLPLFGQCLYHVFLIVPNNSRPPHAGGGLPIGPLPALHPFWVGRASVGIFTQHSTRFMDAKDLKSALEYSMKYEAARTMSKTSRHVRSMEIEDNTSRERDDKCESLFNRLEKLLNSSVAGKKNTLRRNSNVTCWKCNKMWQV